MSASGWPLRSPRLASAFYQVTTIALPTGNNPKRPVYIRMHPFDVFEHRSPDFVVVDRSRGGGKDGE